MTKHSEQEHREDVTGSPVTNGVAGEKSERLPDVSTRTTPLRADIRIDDRRGLTVCNTCGTEDGTVRMLSFKWNDDAHWTKMAGGTAVGLCRSCRRLTANVLNEELK